MKKYIIEIAGYVIVAVAAFFTGSLIAINTTSDQSCYFEGSLWKDVSFRLCKNLITDHDLTKISKDEACELCSKIEDLSYENIFSIHLRKLRDNHKGPFEEKDIDLYIEFADDKFIQNQVASACKGEMLNKQLSIFKIVEPNNIPITNDAMMDFMVLAKQSKATCDGGESVKRTIWINKDVASEWLNISSDLLPDRVKARASIIREILTFEPNYRST